LATDPPSQRVYRALCPNCGAPVEFKSAASVSAVCSYCRSTLVRDGDALRRIGVSAELFDDHSPLQLGAAGRLQGTGFTLVGRLQYGYDGGTWNEWHALFDNGRSGWLSEDNGRYVFAFDAPAQGEVPQADELHAGERRLVDGRPWSVASVTRAKLLAAEGELPRPPRLQGEFTVADLRNEHGEVGTLDYSQPSAPQWSIGRSVALSELAMTGLAEAREKTLGSRSLQCPSCGNALEPKLSTTQTIVCPQCHSVVDISKGIGAELEHYKQNVAGDSGLQPQLPLGSVGSLALGKTGGLQWQVVGYMERCDVPDSADDEQTFWREYLLYHRTAGFAFLVDAEDGWSWVVPITGAPQVRGDRASYEGVDYRKRYSYNAKTTYVLGEFYWRVSRDQRSFNTDYEGTGANTRARLNREMAGTEVTWSAGETLDAHTVAAAFNIPQTQRAAMQRDVSPAGGLSTIAKVVIVVLVVLLLLWLVTRCSRDDCSNLRSTFGENSNEYQQCVRSGGGSGGWRSTGGSFGGYSSGGGGHK
jgi:Zn finger protein HypA/HybF involved in hydrogenase expression